MNLEFFLFFSDSYTNIEITLKLQKNFIVYHLIIDIFDEERCSRDFISLEKKMRASKEVSRTLHELDGGTDSENLFALAIRS